MKIKFLTALISAALLSACGGGSGGSSNKNTASPSENPQPQPETQPTPSNLEVWHTYRIDDSYDSMSEKYDYDIVHAKFTVVSGKLYAELENYEDNEYYLTEDGEYRGFGPINSRYGAQIGDIRVEKNRFIIHPYSEIGSKKLEFTQDHVQLDLSGQSVLAHVDPRLNVSLNFTEQLIGVPPQTLTQLKTFQNLRFPEGSSCLQETQYANNQDYLTLYEPSLSHKTEFLKDEEEFNAQNPHYIKLISFNNALSYLYSWNEQYENASSGYTRYLDQYFDSSLERQRIEYNLADDIRKVRDNANASNDPQYKSEHLAYAEALSKTCDLYNPTAAEYLKQHVTF